MKMFFTNYLEARENLQVSSSPVMVITMTFDAGCNRTRNAGHRTKKACLEWIGMVNTAAGKTIAEYAGNGEPTQ